MDLQNHSLASPDPVPERHVFYYLPGIDVVLHAKFEHCRANGSAAFLRADTQTQTHTQKHTNTQTHSHLYYIDNGKLVGTVPNELESRAQLENSRNNNLKTLPSPANQNA